MPRYAATMPESAAIAAVFTLIHVAARRLEFLWSRCDPQSACDIGVRHFSRPAHRFNGMGVEGFTGTVVMLFFGLPSMSLSEYVR